MSNPYLQPTKSPFEGDGHYKTSDTTPNEPYITPNSIEDTIFQPGHVYTGYSTAKSADNTPSTPIFHNDTDVIRYVNNVLFNNGLHYKLEAYNRDTGSIVYKTYFGNINSEVSNQASLSKGE